MHHGCLRVSPSRSGCWWVVVVRTLLQRWVVLEEAPDRGSRYGTLQPLVGVPVVCFLVLFITRLSCAKVGERAAQDVGLRGGCASDSGAAYTRAENGQCVPRRHYHARSVGVVEYEELWLTTQQ